MMSLTYQPKQGLLFIAQDFFLLPFSMFGIGLGYFFTLMPEIIGVGSWVAYLGYFIIVSQIYFSFIRFFIDLSFRKKISYSIEDQLAIVYVNKKRVHEIDLKRVKIKTEIFADGSGNIWFENQKLVFFILGNSFSGTFLYSVPKAFMYVENVKEIRTELLKRQSG